MNLSPILLAPPPRRRSPQTPPDPAPQVTSRPDFLFLSQLEANGVGYDNCLGACATMVLAQLGAAPLTRDAMHRIAAQLKAPEPWWRAQYTDYPRLREHCSALGHTTTLLESWDRVDARLAAGRPAIVLVRNEPLQPRQYPRGSGWDAAHFIVLLRHNHVVDTYTVADPLSLAGWRNPAGGIGQYTAASVDEGVRRVGGVYALAID